MRSTNGGQARDLERVRYVAANYEHLQGLRKVPLGFLLLLTVCAALLTVYWTSINGRVPESYVSGGFALIFALVVVSIVLPHFISVRYERRFGTVQRYSRGIWFFGRPFAPPPPLPGAIPPCRAATPPGSTARPVANSTPHTPGAGIPPGCPTEPVACPGSARPPGSTRRPNQVCYLACNISLA